MIELSISGHLVTVSVVELVAYLAAAAMFGACVALGIQALAAMSSDREED